MIGITNAALAIVLGGGLGAGICLLLALPPGGVRRAWSEGSRRTSATSPTRRD
ncbi:hypothetical protein [Microbacterium elymi]|uniref:Uncharacterized protein n=1 Tax=Microbacterium elymi TaxID=2909587 RepID=A0ABY5NK76_9MICO|nr:hypothetical protein [Microbacterium elymi]UUT35486.1 hypothetical protein L2X98_19100 [Microbacterium elymi]